MRREYATQKCELVDTFSLGGNQLPVWNPPLTSRAFLKKLIIQLFVSQIHPRCLGTFYLISKVATLTSAWKPSTKMATNKLKST